MKRLIAVVGLSVTLLAPALAEEPCGQWVLKGLHIGMRMQDVRALGLEPEESTRSFLAWKPEGAQWWKGNKKGDFYYHLLQKDGNDPESPIIAMIISLSLPTKKGSGWVVMPRPEVPAATVIKSLSERWGPPQIDDALDSEIHTYNGFGAPRGVTRTYGTMWVNQACDISATAMRQTGSTGTDLPFVGVTMLSISLYSDLEKAFQKGKADQLIDALPQPETPTDDPH